MLLTLGDRPPVERLKRTVPHPRPGDGAAPDRLLAGTRLLLAVFVVFTLLAVNALLVLGGHTDRYFAWTIRSRPNATFLGAAYAAGFVLSVLALRRSSWAQVRLAVVTVGAFAVLTLVPTLLHLHRFNLGSAEPVARGASWVWLAVYLLVPVACLVVVVREQRRRVRPAVVRPMPRALVAVLLTQGAAVAAIGAVLYAGGMTRHLPVDAQHPGWAWPVTPLTSQVVGAWLLSFAVAIVVAVREGDLSRMVVPATAYAVFGAVETVVLLVFRNQAGTAGLWLSLDLVLFASLVPVGMLGARAGRRVGTRVHSPVPSVDLPRRPTRLLEGSLLPLEEPRRGPLTTVSNQPPCPRMWSTTTVNSSVGEKSTYSVSSRASGAWPGAQ